MVMCELVVLWLIPFWCVAGLIMLKIGILFLVSVIRFTL